jgi:SAM-dependent methyltransferase
MRPADDPSIDYQDLVRRGYDQCSDAFSQARMSASPAALAPLLDLLSDGSAVLDLGCGVGVPIARALAERHEVVGVDFSEAQIRRAEANVPAARFFCADILSADFPSESFDAVVSFYVVFHLPREQHAEVFRRVHGWLRPGGYFVVTVSQVNEPAYLEEDFFGATMYWSNFGLGEYRELLQLAGFAIRDNDEIGNGYGSSYPGSPETHPLLFAQKPASAEVSFPGCRPTKR